MAFVILAIFAAPDSITPEAIIARQLQHFQMINCIEYSYLLENIVGQGELPPHTPSVSTSYNVVNHIRSEGPKWRADLDIPGDGSKAGVRSLAFNGTMYQRFHRPEANLVVQATPSSPAFGEAPPTLLPWLPIFGPQLQEENGYDVLKGEEVWREFFQGWVVADETPTVGGLKCVVLEHIEPNSGPSGYRLYRRFFFAEEANYLPVRYEDAGLRGEEKFVRSVTEVTETISAETDAGIAYLPAHVQYTLWNFDGSVCYQRDYEVFDDTMKVNHDVDDGDFTFPLIIALSYYNETDPEQSFRLPDLNGVLRQVASTVTSENVSVEAHRHEHLHEDAKVLHAEVQSTIDSFGGRPVFAIVAGTVLVIGLITTVRLVAGRRHHS